MQRQQLPLVRVRAWRKIFTSGQRPHPNCSTAARLQREQELTSERGREGNREEEGQGNGRGSGERWQDRVRRRLGTEEGKDRNRLSYI